MAETVLLPYFEQDQSWRRLILGHNRHNVHAQIKRLSLAFRKEESQGHGDLQW